MTGGPCVLIVDDDPQIQLLAGHLLRAAGYDVLHADGADTARLVAGGRVPDVILMDVMLGADDGVSLGAELVATAAGAPRLVFLTGTTQAGQHERISRTASAGVLQKPFDPTTFVASLQALLRAGR
jgi:DNA-binding response OmpR family regulator